MDYVGPPTSSDPRTSATRILLNCSRFLHRENSPARRRTEKVPAPSLLTRVAACLAVLFLFSVLTPEPGYVQGCEDSAFPSFVESDATFALCSNPTYTPDRHPCPAYLELVPEAFSWVSVEHSGTFYRGPPLLSLLP